MKEDYWCTEWLKNPECTTENFVRFIIKRERGTEGMEHRERLKTILYATYETYLDMPRIQTHCAYEEELFAMGLWLSQTEAVGIAGENVYQRFIWKVRVNMLEKARRRANARQVKQKKERQLQLFLSGCPVSKEFI